MSKKWYEKSRRRLLLDFHIPDWKEEFLSKFDPEEFADLALKANTTAVTIMANTCTGLCNYPTEAGVIHNKFKDRDIYAETIDALHRRGIDVIMYYCTLYVDQYWDDHPEARIVDSQGKSVKLLHSSTGQATRRRFSICCPNNMAYRKFVVAQLEEICDRYEFEGVWPDMDLWPTVCYCNSCKKRYAEEVGGPIPRTIDWEDPVWVAFQRKRQAWISEFIHMVTDTLKKKKPHLSVAHQSHTYYGNWIRGGSIDAAEANDWLSSDFYGEKYNISFYSKLFYSTSRIKPYEHLNCWNHPMITEHIISRTADELKMNIYTALINDGAMLFINAINPDGTLHREAFETMGDVYSQAAMPYEEHAGGKPCADVAIYFSYNCNFDMAENGRDVITAGYTFSPTETPTGPTAMRNAAISAAKALMYAHIPFGAITKKNIDSLPDYQVIILPNVVMLDSDEIEALKRYVEAGGSLYASKYTSIISVDGTRQDNFMLSDLFGVTYAGITAQTVTYVAPADKYTDLFPGFSANWPVTYPDSQLKVKTKGAEVIANLTLPYTDPTETRYASILTDPPDRKTDYASVTINSYKKGRVIYAAGAIETWDHDSQRAVFINLIDMLATRPYCFKTDAPKAVEVTMFDQPDNKRYILHILNYQQELPNIPVSGINLKVYMKAGKPGSVKVLPGGSDIKFQKDGDCIEFVLPELKDYMMIEVGYR